MIISKSNSLTSERFIKRNWNINILTDSKDWNIKISITCDLGITHMEKSGPLSVITDSKVWNIKLKELVTLTWSSGLVGSLQHWEPRGNCNTQIRHNPNIKLSSMYFTRLTVYLESYQRDKTLKCDKYTYRRQTWKFEIGILYPMLMHRITLNFGN